MILKQNQKTMRSFLVFAMVLFMTGFLFAGINNTIIKAYAAVTKLSGTGVEGDPYLISNAEELRLIRNNLNGHYKLVANIDFKGQYWNPVGKNSEEFKGKFDGNNYEISNFKINSQNGYQGLFACTNNATISNLTLRGVEIKSSGSYVGTLIGDAHGTTNVINCHVRDCKVSGNEYVGGLIGRTYTGNCYVSSSVADIRGTGCQVGGLIGYASASMLIENCYSLGSVVGKDEVAGLIGVVQNSSIVIKNCYTSSKVSITYRSSYKIAGLYTGEATVYDSYYDGEVCRITNDENYNRDKLTAAMLLKSTYKNWDFNNVWAIDEGESYPYLKNADKPGKVIAASYISEGNGTIEKPYLIRNREQLELVRYDRFSCYKLMNDIDLKNEPWTPIGRNWKEFRGNFEGSNHEIKNLKINSSSDYYGLFACTESATISNLTIRGAEINANTSYVGALIGDAQYQTNVTNCHLRDGRISGNEYVGGLIGRGYKGVYTRLSSVADVNGTSGHVGGLVGFIQAYTVLKDCYSQGNVSGEDYVGGLVGRVLSSTEKIENCYSASKVNLTDTSGYKISGLYVGELNACNSYYDKDVCGFSKYNLNYGRTTSQMYTKANFVNWDFDNIWSIDEGTSYPYFKDIDNPEQEEIIPIRTKEDLEAMRENKFRSYKLMNDIDLEGMEWNPIGTIEKPFVGRFYGRGYSIYNFKINNESDNQGLFGCTKDSSISHLKLRDVTINGAKDNVGAIVGNALGKTNIVYCSVENSTISGQSSVGGLAGRVEDGICALSLSDASITGSVKDVGGFIGKIDGNFRVENCKAISEICGRENVAGLIGYTDYPKTTIIVNSYSLSKLTKMEEGLSDTFGGLYNGTATVLRSYYVSDIWDNSASSDNKWSRTLEEMYSKDTFANWDFNNIWSIRGENVTPYFKIKTKKPGFTDKTVSGILIEDQDGLVTIPGATVNARKESQDGEIEKTVTTDSEGIFRFDSLGVGKYVLEISAEGYITRYFEFDNEKGKDLGDILVKPTLG